MSPLPLLTDPIGALYARLPDAISRRKRMLPNGLATRWNCQYQGTR